MKIATVVGARPQFVKAAAVSRALRRRPRLEEVIIHTGQHFDRDMSAVFFEELGIPAPRYNLGINSLSHGAMTGKMLAGVEKVLLAERPAAVMVYGDTNSTLAGALAAKKLHLKVVHVEAGLRSFNMRMPEEINRVLVDRISDLLCCPTDTAVANLRAEGFDKLPCTIVKTGDVMQDAALHYRGMAAARSRIVQDLDLEGREYLLCTVHRPENTDDPARLSGIVEALDALSRETAVVLPLHPRTAKALKRLRRKTAFSSIPPVGYLDMMRLLSDASAVLTDSGGLQKEAFFFGKPCITLRDETEWTELVEGGYNTLAGAGRDRILAAYREMRGRALDYGADLYGGGRAAARTSDAIRQLVGE